MRMACFLVPMALGIVTALLHRKFPKNLHSGWLNALLWGGTLMLTVEHIAHGEIVPHPPFLTAGLSALPEILNIGVPMAVANVGIWATMVLVSSRMTRLAGGTGREIGGRTGMIKER